MTWFLRKCCQCGSYTLKKYGCPYCGKELKVPHPPKFSPDDKYLRYRIALKMGVQNSEKDSHQRTQEG